MPLFDKGNRGSLCQRVVFVVTAEYLPPTSEQADPFDFEIAHDVAAIPERTLVGDQVLGTYFSEGHNVEG